MPASYPNVENVHLTGHDTIGIAIEFVGGGDLRRLLRYLEVIGMPISFAPPE